MCISECVSVLRMSFECVRECVEDVFSVCVSECVSVLRMSLECVCECVADVF